MPERARVIHQLANDILGTGISWHYHTAKPEGAQDALDEAEARYVAVVEEVNWSRIALEALTRCMRSDHPSNDDMAPQPCGNCIKAELLVVNSWDRGTPTPVLDTAS